jgi:hypothetical protein
MKELDPQSMRTVNKRFDPFGIFLLCRSARPENGRKARERFLMAPLAVTGPGGAAVATRCRHSRVFLIGQLLPLVFSQTGHLNGCFTL